MINFLNFLLAFNAGVSFFMALHAQVNREGGAWVFWLAFVVNTVVYFIP